MQTVQLDWQQSAVLGAGLMAARVAVTHNRVRPLRRGAPYLNEAAIIAALYTLWQLAAQLSLVGSSGAFRRGRWIVDFQRRVHLPSERAAQHLIVGHPRLEQLSNLYYAGMHFGVLGAFLLWLFVRHRDRYPFVRNVLVVLTATSLAIQLVPVAPPRLLPDLGYIDTAARYGQSVYDQSVVTVDQFAAMPSVHVGWALLVGWAVVRVSASRHRCWVLAHPAITIFVVAATANHFWLDGIVSGLLLLMSIGIVGLVERLRSRRADGPVEPAPGRLDDGDPRMASIAE